MKASAKSDRDILVSNYTDLKWIKKQMGPLASRVSANEKWRYGITGALILLSFLISYGFIWLSKFAKIIK